MAIIGDLLRIQHWCTQGDQAAVNTFHYKVTATAGVPPTDQAIVDHFHTLGSNNYPNALVQTAKYKGATLQRLSPPPLGPVILSSFGPVDGLRVGDPLPGQVSGIVWCRGDQSSRHHRGRAYIPFPSEDSNDAFNVPDAQYQNTLLLLAQNLYGTVVVGVGGDTVTLDPYIFSRTLAATFLIVSKGTRPKWATQRRRGAFGARNVSPFG